MTREEKELYDRKKVTSKMLEKEMKQYSTLGRNVYTTLRRDDNARREWGNPNADNTGMALAGYLRSGETIEAWVERKIRMRDVIDYRADFILTSKKNAMIKKGLKPNVIYKGKEVY